MLSGLFRLLSFGGVCDTNLIQIRRTSLQLTSHHQNSLQSSEAKIIVILSRQLPFGQLVKDSHLFRQNLKPATTVKI